MKHKKFCLILASALVVFSSYCAYPGGEKAGIISQARTTAKDYSKAMA